MDIHHLKIFAAVYKNRSFSRASEELHISQPTVSEHIKNLESELECKLFDRMGRAIIPTAQADLILPRALQIIAEVTAIPTLLMETGMAISGHLIIGASTIPGTYLLPALAARFKEKYPAVSFEIPIHDTAHITDMVVGHDLLFGVVGAPTEQSRLSLQPFYDDELVCAGTAALVQDRQRQGLAGVPFIQREKGSGTRLVAEKFLRERGVEQKDLQIVATLGSTASVKEAVKAGLGISILSKMAIREELAAGSLHTLELPGPAMIRSFYLMRHKKRSLPPHYQAFYDMVANAFRVS